MDLETVSHNGLDTGVYDLRPADYTTTATATATILHTVIVRFGRAPWRYACARNSTTSTATSRLCVQPKRVTESALSLTCRMQLILVVGKVDMIDQICQMLSFC